MKQWKAPNYEWIWANDEGLIIPVSKCCPVGQSDLSLPVWRPSCTHRARRGGEPRYPLVRDLQTHHIPPLSKKTLACSGADMIMKAVGQMKNGYGQRQSWRPQGVARRLFLPEGTQRCQPWHISFMKLRVKACEHTDTTICCHDFIRYFYFSLEE